MNSSENQEVQMPLFAGVDVGGTNVKIGLADSNANVIAQSHFPTEQERGPQYALGIAAARIGELAEEAGYSSRDIAAVGLGTPGTMDIPAGMILEPPNLSGWRNFNVRESLSNATGKPVTFTNDANAAAYGEYWAGGGAAYGSMVLFTLGTGVGGGVIMGDHWIDGAHSHGAEVGHIMIDSSDSARICSCGQRGHLEAYASATAVVARTKERIEAGTKSSLSSVEEITAFEVSKAAEAGDRLATEIVFETADYLARLLP